MISKKIIMHAELSRLEEAVREAGDAVIKIAKDGFETAYKANKDPVTAADLAADAVLKRRLLDGFGDCGWLSEETSDDPGRLKKNRVWIVDPIDGTKEFVSGIDEFAVSAALVDNGQPVLAAVYNPAADRLFTAVKGEGVWLNAQPIKVRNNAVEKPLILASRSEVKRGEFEVFEPFVQLRVCGSIAYKLALVAAGQADATFSLGPKNEWDIAAGVLILQQAGGKVTDLTGDSFLFNQRQPLVNGIIAASMASYSSVTALIRQICEQKK